MPAQEVAARRDGWVDAGRVVVDVPGERAVDKESALTALAHALGLPPSTHDHYDALADSLRDLDTLHPRAAGVLAVWHSPDTIRAAAPQVWRELVDIVREADTEAAELRPEAPRLVVVTAEADETPAPPAGQR